MIQSVLSYLPGHVARTGHSRTWLPWCGPVYARQFCLHCIAVAFATSFGLNFQFFQLKSDLSMKHKKIVKKGLETCEKWILEKPFSNDKDAKMKGKEWHCRIARGLSGISCGKGNKKRKTERQCTADRIWITLSRSRQSISPMPYGSRIESCD